MVDQLTHKEKVYKVLELEFKPPGSIPTRIQGL